MIVLGGGAVDAGAPALAIAEALGAMILTTIAGKGIVPSDHPLCLGHPDGARQDPQETACGGPMSSLRSEPKSPRPICGKPTIDHSRQGHPHRHRSGDLAAPACRRAADPGRCRRGARRSRRRPAERDGRRPAQRRPRHSFRDYLRREPDGEDELRSLLRMVLAVIRQALPRETVIASDMTQIAYAANEIFHVEPAAQLAASGRFRHARLRASRRPSAPGRGCPTVPSPR